MIRTIAHDEHSTCGESRKTGQSRNWSTRLLKARRGRGGAISVLSAAPDSDAAADSPVSQRRQVLTRMPGWPQRLGVAAVSAARQRTFSINRRPGRRPGRHPGTRDRRHARPPRRGASAMRAGPAPCRWIVSLGAGRKAPVGLAHSPSLARPLDRPGVRSGRTGPGATQKRATAQGRCLSRSRFPKGQTLS